MKFTEIGSTCITHCDPDLSPALALVPSVSARVWRPCLAAFLPDPAILASAARAGRPQAVAAACDLELQGVPAVERLGLTSEHLRPLFAVTVSAARLDRPAGVE